MAQNGIPPKHRLKQGFKNWVEYVEIQRILW
jgi:hypothetical protein